MEKEITESGRLQANRWGWQRGYQRIQETKPVTLGYALHDSPVGMLAWFAGKLKAWTDDYPWTPDELIHWAFIHYQGSPSAAMQIYKEAEAVLNEGKNSMLGKYITQPVGGSLFPNEVSSAWVRSFAMVPDSLTVCSFGCILVIGWKRLATSSSGSSIPVEDTSLRGSDRTPWRLMSRSSMAALNLTLGRLHNS
jgi:hypothetical protein